MSMHKVPMSEIEQEGLEKHGLFRGLHCPSQLADAFRLGFRWGKEKERQRCVKVCEEVREEDCWSGSNEYAVVSECIEKINSDVVAKGSK